MKNQNIYLLVTLVLTVNIFASNSLRSDEPNSKSGKTIAFTENKGQVCDQYYNARPDVLFGTMTDNMAVHIKRGGLSYQLYRTESYKDVEDPRSKIKRTEIDQQTIYRIDLNWINHNQNFTTSAEKEFGGYNNYYLESCPDGALNVKSYGSVILHKLYNGIDLHYYSKNGELKHDYIVSPRADYKQIQIQVEGADLSVNPDGSLLLTTSLGKVQEGAPIVFQNGKQLKARWLIIGRNKNILSFEIENCNPNYELVIDPITRMWGTYYGGNVLDQAYCGTADGLGNTYFTGLSTSNTGTIIATSGSHQIVSGGYFDAFLVKMNAGGTRLWGTYYGGNGSDITNCCSVDTNGNIYIVGETESSTNTVIATLGAHQQNYGGGTRDAFLVKFNLNGIRQWGTYYGGSNNDFGAYCTTDVNGNVIITGYTSSTNNNVISTSGSHQTVFSGGYDAFLVKFSASGVRQWGTYYGGNGGPDEDYGSSCFTDGSNNIYLFGSTGTNTGTTIATASNHQPNYGGGVSDAFLVMFNSNGVRQWGTYYGGTGDDYANVGCIDGLNNIYLTGFTTSNSGTSIATTLSHQSTNGGGVYDGFLVKFDANGLRQWGTYYGGNGSERGECCTTDISGNVYLAGFTSSNGNTTIATPSGHQPNYGGGNFDAFLAKFNSNGVRQTGSYYGGTGQDRAYSCVVDVNNHVYLVGDTDSNTGNNIATNGSHQTIYGGGTMDAFVAKFDVCDVAPMQPGSISGTTNLCSNSSGITYSTTNIAGATSYNWLLPSGWSGSSTTNSISATPGASGIISVAASNACGTSSQQIVNVVVNTLPIITLSTNVATLCEGESATLTANGASSYTFSPGGIGNSFVISPAVNTTYSVVGIDVNGCTNTTTFVQNVDLCTGIKEATKTDSEIKLYPNPNSGLVNIVLDSHSEIVIVNTLGQIVFTRTLEAGISEINLDGLKKGVYFIGTKTQNKLQSAKLIIE